MKSKKRPLLITLGIIAIVAVGVLIYLMLHDENKLTVEERTWINANLSTVQNINIINDLNIYAKDGHGVFYDFLTDFGSEYNLRMNPIISNDAPSNIFKDTTTITDQSLIFEEDHYVLVGKNEEIINRSAISNLSIGVLNSDADYIKSFLTLRLLIIVK